MAIFGKDRNYAPNCEFGSFRKIDKLGKFGKIERSGTPAPKKLAFSDWVGGHSMRIVACSVLSVAFLFGAGLGTSRADDFVRLANNGTGTVSNLTSKGDVQAEPVH